MYIRETNTKKRQLFEREQRRRAKRELEGKKGKKRNDIIITSIINK